MIRFAWGELQLSLLQSGSIWLDGGAMFGIVPRPLWERERRPDDRNRIHLAMNLLLIDDGKQKTLVDTGAGTKWDEKSRRIYGLETRSADEVLAPAGITPAEIDRVINSHLHFDHAGGNTVLDEDRRLRPAFPNAEYIVQAGELETARDRNDRTSASYLEDSFEPLIEEGRVRLVEGEVELGAGLTLSPAPGHTPHMQIVLVTTGQGTLAFLADLVPTTSHIRYPYIMGFDLEPLVTLATKRRILPRAVAEDWWIVFEHDAETPLGRIVENGGRLEARPIVPEA